MNKFFSTVAVLSFLMSAVALFSSGAKIYADIKYEQFALATLGKQYIELGMAMNEKGAPNAFRVILKAQRGAILLHMRIVAAKLEPELIPGPVRYILYNASRSE